MDLIIFCTISTVIVGGCIVAFTLVKQKKSGKQYGKIEPTKNIIVSIREIAELTTASFFCETAVVEQKRKKIANNLIGDFINKVGGNDMEDNIMDKLCLIASGIVRAGYDLKKIKEDDMKYISYEPNMSEDMIELYKRVKEDCQLSKIDLSNLSSLSDEEYNAGKDYISISYQNLQNLKSIIEKSEQE